MVSLGISNPIPLAMTFHPSRIERTALRQFHHVLACHLYMVKGRHRASRSSPPCYSKCSRPHPTI